jgi:ATP-dependent DNA ligase
MRTRCPDEPAMVFLAFDLLHQDGVDLRSLPLSERKRDLDRLCKRAKVPATGRDISRWRDPA